jgi:hypothetical protein
VGIVLACLYHFASMHTTSWLTGKGKTAFPILSVAGFFLRVTLLGVIFAAMAVWLRPQVNLVATALAFIAAFTVLTGFSLYRFAMGGRASRNTTRVTP